MKLMQSIRERMRGRKATTLDLALDSFYQSKLRDNQQEVASRLKQKTGGWEGGEAFLKRLATAPSPFALEEELRMAARMMTMFGEDILSEKTKQRAARIAETKMAELRGQLLRS